MCSRPTGETNPSPSLLSLLLNINFIHLYIELPSFNEEINVSFENNSTRNVTNLMEIEEEKGKYDVKREKGDHSPYPHPQQVTEKDTQGSVVLLVNCDEIWLKNL